jgi:hypothetical protein
VDEYVHNLFWEKGSRERGIYLTGAESAMMERRHFEVMAGVNKH